MLIEGNINNQEQIQSVEKYIENIDSKIKKPIYLCDIFTTVIRKKAKNLLN